MVDELEIITLEQYVNDKQIFEKFTLNTMWHYTSVDAFINIVKNKSLRFTDCLFLNDIEEYNYIKLVVNEYKKRNLVGSKQLVDIFELTSSSNEDMLLLKKEQSLKFSEGRYYVLCGTTKNDFLPMWNYYSKSSHYEGYSININIKSIFENFLKNNKGEIAVGKVIYNLDDQINVIKNKISSLEQDFDNEMDEFKKEKIDDKDECYLREQSIIDNYQEGIFDLLKYCRLFFKDEKFSFEDEIRVVILANSKEQECNVCSEFTSFNGIVKPSIDFKIDSPFAVEKLIVSPTIDFNLCELGIRRLLKDNGLKHFKKDFEIKRSDYKVRY